MKKLTSFIKGIIENGNATLIESTSEPNVYNVTVYQYNKFGYLIRSFSQNKYDREYIIDGKINPLAQLRCIKKLEKPKDLYGSLICKLIKDDLSSDKSIVLTSSESKCGAIVHSSEINFIFNLSEHILGISNHKIACAVSTSLDYLENYLLEQLSENIKIDSVGKEDNRVEDQKDIATIDEAEKALIERIDYISSIATKLRDQDLSREEYYEIYPEWIRLYDDRSFNKCIPNQQDKENRLNLLTTKQ